MRKFFILFPVVLLFFCSNISAQQVEREYVVIEIGTGTWCSWCPGAATGADDMVANGHDVAIIENHNNDVFANVYSNARNSYYGISSWPTAYFDGVVNYIGGAQCPNPTGVYSVYLSRYNTRKAVPSSFTMEMDFSNTGYNYNVDLTIAKVASTTTTNLVLHVVVNESHIPQAWQGCMSECNFVNRLMAPNQNGTALDFSGGDTIYLNLSFAMDPSWQTEECELIAFIQNTQTKEIQQATKKSMATPQFNFDASITGLLNVPDGNCSGKIVPSVTLKNWGGEILTNLSINYMVNNGELSTYEWTGSLEFLEEEMVDLNPVSFEVQEENEFMVYASNPNGQPDENTGNDTVAQDFSMAVIADYYRVSLLLKTDGAPQETTYEVLDESGSVLYSGGPFTMANHVYKDTFNLYVSGCYQFIMYDEGGNGLEGGYYTLREAYIGGSTIGTGNQFGYMETNEFTIDWVGVEEESPEKKIFTIYPNPVVKEACLNIDLEQSEEVILNIYNIDGKLIYKQSLGVLPTGENRFYLDKNQLDSGLNFIQVTLGDRKFSKKIIVK